MIDQERCLDCQELHENCKCENIIKTFRVKVELEREVEAESSEEAEHIFWETLEDDLAMENITFAEKMRESIEIENISVNEEINMSLQDSSNMGGTCLQGYVEKGMSYNDLIEVFGEPNCEGDGYKTDAEWIGTINETTFTIYNYKTGKNYLGSEGKEVKDIRDWHIGGNNIEVVKLINDYIKIKLKRVG